VREKYSQDKYLLNALFRLIIIIAILLGILYGSFADQYGRRLILALSFFGMSMGAAWIQVVCELFVFCQPLP
jgi:MFS family permease